MTIEQPYETLDPQNWDDMRKLAHRMVDDALTHLETLRERPVWQPIPDEITARFEVPAPHDPIGAEATYEEFKETIVPYQMGNTHPHWTENIVCGSRSPIIEAQRKTLTCLQERSFGLERKSSDNPCQQLMTKFLSGNFHS